MDPTLIRYATGRFEITSIDKDGVKEIAGTGCHIHFKHGTFISNMAHLFRTWHIFFKHGTFFLNIGPSF